MNEEKDENLPNETSEAKKKKGKIKNVIIGVACALVLATAIVVPTTLHFLNNTEYTIVLDYGTLGTPDGSQSLEKGSTVADIQPATIDGYIFIGFFADAGFNEKLDPSTEITESMTIYLKYEAVVEKYSISLNFVGVGRNAESFTLSEGQTLADIEVPQIEDYNFVGFFSDADCLVPLAETTPVESNMTIYLKYEEVIEKYSISLNFVGVVRNKETFTLTEGQTLANIKVPQIEDYNFVGFFSDADCLVPLVETTPVTQSMEIYLQYVFDVTSQFEFLERLDENDQLIGYSVLYHGSAAEVVIPSSYENIPVIGIDFQAFYGCSNLTSVTIPNSVLSIGYQSFMNCSNLKTINIPNSVTTIDNEAFANCDGLTSITIPESVTEIELYAFRDCSNLKSVVISGETTIGMYAFMGCTNLESVVIGSGVRRIVMGAFNNCSSLTDVTIDSAPIYNGLTSSSSYSNLILNATTIRVLKSVVDDVNNSSTYLEENFTRAEGEGEFADYYIFTKATAE